MGDGVQAYGQMAGMAARMFSVRDVELYRQLLGIEAPWKVERVELSEGEQKVEVTVGHARGLRWPCPECGLELGLYDHGEERVWRHLDSCGFTTWLKARPPRVACPTHGVRQVALPWAEPHSRFTILLLALCVHRLRIFRPHLRGLLALMMEVQFRVSDEKTEAVSYSRAEVRLVGADTHRSDHPVRRGR